MEVVSSSTPHEQADSEAIAANGSATSENSGGVDDKETGEDAGTTGTQAKPGMKRKYAEMTTITTSTQEVGVIVPPPAIKVLVDRTSDFVRKNGVAFEQEIMNRNKGQKKFEFLLSTHPYHAYYKQRLQYGDNLPAELAAAQQPVENQNAAAAAEQQKIAAIKKKPVKKKRVATLPERLQEQANRIHLVKDELVPSEEPPQKYTIETPNRFQPVDIEIIKLTSQFVARNGRAFLAGLTKREHRNPQFDFLKPTHPLFTYFQELVDAYAQIIMPPKALLETLRKESGTPSLILEQAMGNKRFREQQRELGEEAERDLEKERVAMQLIDWHTFVVVETITFNPEDDEYLPQPKATVEEISRMLAAQATEADMREVEEEEMDMDDVDMDMEDSDNDADMDMEEEEEEEEEVEPVRRTAVDMSLDKKRMADDKAIQVQKCPSCGQMIPVDEIEEHMRLELLDPQWKKGQEEIASRRKETVFAANTSIMQNLSKFAGQRADVFAGVEDEIQALKADTSGPTFRDLIQKQQAQALANAPKPPPQQMQRMQQRQQAPRQQQQRPPMQQQRPPMQQQRPPIQMVQQQQPKPPQQPPIPQIQKPSGPGGTQAEPFIHPSRRAQAPTSNKPMQAAQVSTPQPARIDPGALLRGAAGRPPAPPPQQKPPFQPTNPSLSRPTQPPLPGMSGGRPAVANPFGMMGRHPGMPPMMGQMAGGFPGAPPMPGAGAASSDGSIPEDAFLRQHGAKPIRIIVQVPNDPSKSFNFNGQSMEMLLPLTETVGALKARISAALNNMPIKKMKLNVLQSGTFLNKDDHSLAKYNVLPNTFLVVGMRSRGRK